jgi:hypothetical protein
MSPLIIAIKAKPAKQKLYLPKTKEIIRPKLPRRTLSGKAVEQKKISPLRSPKGKKGVREFSTWSRLIPQKIKQVPRRFLRAQKQVSQQTVLKKAGSKQRLTSRKKIKKPS